MKRGTDSKPQILRLVNKALEVIPETIENKENINVINIYYSFLLSGSSSSNNKSP